MQRGEPPTWQPKLPRCVLLHCASCSGPNGGTSAKTAPGVDGQTVEEAKEDGPCTGISPEARPIGVPCVADRALQRRKCCPMTGNALLVRRAAGSFHDRIAGRKVSWVEADLLFEEGPNHEVAPLRRAPSSTLACSASKPAPWMTVHQPTAASNVYLLRPRPLVRLKPRRVRSD